MEGSYHLSRSHTISGFLSCGLILCVPLVTRGGLSSRSHREVCEPTADGFGCVPVSCSIAGELCIPTVLHLDIATGAITAVVCDCTDPNTCHVEFGNATAFPVGSCPPGETCEVFGSDTDNDGIDDQFTAACVPAQPGGCCLDIDDGPVGYDTCQESDEAGCEPNGGVFQGEGTACDSLQACCIGLDVPPYCADVEPFCCVLSGGVPQGPGVTCDDLAQQGGCGQLCGGIASIPCEDANEFCRLPVGHCCCDFFGTCASIPDVCLPYVDPVCGCDGATYLNPCEAYRVGVSIDHFGPCDFNCGVLGIPCPDGQICVYEPGTCGFLERPGICLVIETCPTVVDPVCGCDGQTYGNACLADLAGVGVNYAGPCRPGCPHTCGDIDGSGGNVNLVDFAYLSLCFGGPADASQTCTCSDLNGDGTVNLADFATFSLAFGSVSTNAPPNCP